MSTPPMSPTEPEIPASENTDTLIPTLKNDEDEISESTLQIKSKLPRKKRKSSQEIRNAEKRIRCSSGANQDLQMDIKDEEQSNMDESDEESDESEIDIWDVDPTGLYGLSKEFLVKADIRIPLTRWVHVRNLGCSKEALKELLEMAGQLLYYDYFRTKTGYAKVKYSHPLEAAQAVSMLNGQIFHGRILSVSIQPHPAPENGLPTGLQKMGPGFGLNGKPLKDIVRQYERYVKGKNTELNCNLFLNNKSKKENVNIDTDAIYDVIKEVLSKGVHINDVIKALRNLQPNSDKNSNSEKKNEDAIDMNDSSIKSSLSKSDTESYDKIYIDTDSKTSSIISDDEAMSSEQQKQSGSKSQSTDTIVISRSPKDTTNKGDGWNTRDMVDSESNSRNQLTQSNLRMSTSGNSIWSMRPIIHGAPVYNSGGNFIAPGNTFEPNMPGRQMGPIGPPHFRTNMNPLSFQPAGQFRTNTPVVVTNFGQMRPIGPNNEMLSRPNIMGPPGPICPPSNMAIPGPMGPPINMQGGPSITVVVENLPPHIAKEVVFSKMKVCGEVRSIEWQKPGCFLVLFPNMMAAQSCVNQYNNIMVDGHKLNVYIR